MYIGTPGTAEYLALQSYWEPHDTFLYSFLAVFLYFIEPSLHGFEVTREKRLMRV